MTQDEKILQLENDILQLKLEIELLKKQPPYQPYYQPIYNYPVQPHKPFYLVEC